MPFHAHSQYRQSLHRTFSGNQACPLLVSSQGRYVWSETPFAFEFKDGWLYLDETSENAIIWGQAQESDLRGAYLAAGRKFFPPDGQLPHELSFLAPQYNTWIDMGKHPTQEKVLRYAQDVLKAGMRPGVLIIDDFWYRNNGVWEWDALAFPQPKALIEQLHQLGFMVVLWVSPWVTADTRTYQELAAAGYLLMADQQVISEDAELDQHREKAPILQHWWNGASAVLDLSNPEAFGWFQSQLDRLAADYNVDGFKFDGGDPFRYQPSDLSFASRTPSGHCEDYGRIGLKYSLSEYRACWKLGNQPLIQRVRDKAHVWGQGGLWDTIPTSLAHGLMGYPYTCPDMVGGGELGGVPEKIDPELYIRWAQSATFFPIIQYSMLPNRVLDDQHLALCMEVIKLREHIAPEILRFAKHAAQTGEPIMRHMAYQFPDAQMEQIHDQYMLGDRYLVAPVINKGQVRRLIRFPGGRWLGDDGSIVEGFCEMEVEAPLSRLPWYTRLD
ncbi:MAG: glycoside hydrolase [Anaerolineae bacterium]|nr:glycoside hydrolase [Anaerolineae bacterium]